MEFIAILVIVHPLSLFGNKILDTNLGKLDETNVLWNKSKCNCVCGQSNKKWWIFRCSPQRQIGEGFKNLPNQEFVLTYGKRYA